MAIVDRSSGLESPHSPFSLGITPRGSSLAAPAAIPTPAARATRAKLAPAAPELEPNPAPPAPEGKRRRAIWALAMPYLLTAMLALTIIARLMNLSRADFHIPFAYGGDALMFQTWCDALLHHGWYLRNPLLGAPEIQKMEDFPQVDSLNFLIVKFFGLFTDDTQVALNLFCLATFVLPAVTGLFVMRRLGAATPVAMACSLLYTFLPYHFIRLGGHYCLTCYYIAPLSILLAMRIYQGQFPGAAASDSSEPARASRAKIWAGAIGICLLQASAGLYYAFFAMYFQAIAGLAVSLQQRRVRPLLCSILLVVVTTGGVAANLAPTFSYWIRHGRNQEIAARVPAETERYGFKLAALMLPIPGHRVDAIRDFRNHYESASVNSNENMWSAQGMLANLGFIVLLGMLLYRGAASKLLEGLSVLNLFGILFATTGGLGMIFSMLVMPHLRSQNRVSVFLSFFSLLCVAYLLTFIWRRYSGSKAAQCLMCGLLVGMTLLGIWDQHPPGSRPDYSLVHRRWANDVVFVGEIEKAMPPGAMIYQMPYAQYPEQPPVVNFSASDGIRFSLHSRAALDQRRDQGSRGRSVAHAGGGPAGRSAA